MSDNFKERAQAHTELNIFSVLTSILDGGHIYTNKSQKAANKIIAICNREQRRLIKIYDNIA